MIANILVFYIFVTTVKQYGIGAGSSVQPVNRGRKNSFAGVLYGGQCIRYNLEGVIAPSSK